MATVEELEAKRAARKAETDKARAEQYAKDLAAIDALECENLSGGMLDISLRVTNFVPGLPSLVGVRAPKEIEYKRFFQQINRAGNADAKMAALEQMAKTCWVYPADEAQRKAMLEANPGLIACVGNLANKLAEMQTAEEGKT
jgi:hypothetical protein